MLEWLVLTIDRSAPGTSGNAGGPSDAPDLKISLLKAVRFVYGAWYEVRQTTIQNCFKKAGFVRQDQPPSSSDSDSETGTETADLTELWEHVATVDADSGCVASVEDFLTADSAASLCDELTDEAIVADVLSRQAVALCDGSDSSDEEVDSASTTPSMTTQVCAAHLIYCEPLSSRRRRARSSSESDKEWRCNKKRKGKGRRTWRASSTSEEEEAEFTEEESSDDNRRRKTAKRQPHSSEEEDEGPSEEDDSSSEKKTKKPQKETSKPEKKKPAPQKPKKQLRSSSEEEETDESEEEEEESSDAASDDGERKFAKNRRIIRSDDESDEEKVKETAEVKPTTSNSKEASKATPCGAEAAGGNKPPAASTEPAPAKQSPPDCPVTSQPNPPQESASLGEASTRPAVVAAIQGSPNLSRRLLAVPETRRSVSPMRLAGDDKGFPEDEEEEDSNKGFPPEEEDLEEKGFPEEPLPQPVPPRAIVGVSHIHQGTTRQFARHILSWDHGHRMGIRTHMETVYPWTVPMGDHLHQLQRIRTHVDHPALPSSRALTLLFLSILIRRHSHLTDGAGI
ncbi:hypothetical protein MRX96_019393 [Rhipicephalus microplus]